MSDRETQPGSIIPGVDWESGVKRLMGNEQLYRKLLAKFAASYGDAAGRIRDALSAVIARRLIMNCIRLRA